MSDHSELKRLAEACLEEEQKCPQEVLTIQEARAYNLLLSDFEDKANPSTVLELFAEIERLRNTTSASMFESVSAENKRLSELLECAQGDLKQAMQIIESLTPDAERYRWLRDPDHCQEDFLDGPADNIVVGSCGGEDILWAEQLDAAVDAAMSKEG